MAIDRDSESVGQKLDRLEKKFDYFRIGLGLTIGLVLFMVFNRDGAQILNAIAFPVIVVVLLVSFAMKWRTGWRPSRGMGTTLSVLGGLIVLLLLVGLVVN